MIVEDLIKVTESNIRIYSDENAFCLYHNAEPVYEGYSDNVPYKFIKLKVLKVRANNYTLDVIVIEDE